MSKIERGCEIEHIVTGMKGICGGYLDSLNGSVQYCLKRPGTDKDGKTYGDKWLDALGVKYVGKGKIAELNIVEETETDIELGMTVKHLNGFKGIAMERVVYLDGCVHFGVMAKTDKDNKMPELQYIACQYLSQVVTKKKVESEADDRGGPESSAPHRA